jgi:hypothetical protein
MNLMAGKFTLSAHHVHFAIECARMSGTGEITLKVYSNLCSRQESEPFTNTSDSCFVMLAGCWVAR